MEFREWLRHMECACYFCHMCQLLRVLETGELRPVVGSDCRVASFRLIAATNRILEQRVADSEFRSDLFYRLNVFRIELPSLRDRMDDIPALADRFLAKVFGNDGRHLRISPEAVQELQSRAWYGNVRELRNVLESASVICRGDTIEPDHLPAPVPSLFNTALAAVQSGDDQLFDAVEAWANTQLEERGPACSDLYERFLKAVEPRLIEAALKRVNGQRGEAAKLLGIHRETLREKLRRLDDERA